MPIRQLEGQDVPYYLAVFDENGIERCEDDGSFLSDTVERLVADATNPISDVFFMSHGWKGDVPAAIAQYDAWLGTMAALPGDRAAAEARAGGFSPIIIGLHWPSLPWGDEIIPAQSSTLLSSGDPGAMPIETLIDQYAATIASTPTARSALRTILEAARGDSDATNVPPAIKDAYSELAAEAGLRDHGVSGRPGLDHDAFDPNGIISAEISRRNDIRSGLAPGVLGLGDEIKDVLLMPLRQLSFWKMKDRARQFGESSGHVFLRRLQLASTHARFHLMGHSFGCIVVSSTIAGRSNGQPVPRSVDSLFLVQGALSLWSYANNIPYARGTGGYFASIIKNGLIRGPIVTTRSTYDVAVGRFYPIGALLKRQLVLGDEFPEYGGVGTFGLQGVTQSEDLPMQSIKIDYAFKPGVVYNLAASSIIKNGSGASGAHNDIAHPEVAHAFWAAILYEQGSSELGSFDNAKSVPTKGLLSADDDLDELLGADSGGSADSFLRVGSRSADEVHSESAPRWINAELEDCPRDEALSPNKWYTLAVDIDLAQRHDAIAAVPLQEHALFDEVVDEIVLTVELDSSDFEIFDCTRPIRLGRWGRSHNKARFDISPRHDGPSFLKATIHKDGNFIQQLELMIDIGGAAGAIVLAAAKGRPLTAARILRPRDVGLSISPANGGYDCVVWGAVAARAHLPLQPGYVESSIEALRRDLMKVVMYQDGAGQWPFQAEVEISEVDCSFALETLARAGARLFQQMFFGPGAGVDSRLVGSFIRRMASGSNSNLRIQILAESLPVPWGLLYVGEARLGAKLDWNSFLGIRHVIEQIPLQPTLSVCDYVIASDRPQLSVSINLHTGIDRQMRASFVADQQAFWESARLSKKRICVTERRTSAEVLRALSDEKTDDQIVYFYCHAESKGLTDPQGIDASSLVFGDARITLESLNIDAGPGTQLTGNPLVFINACESADMSPTFYDGFVPYFMSKGARGVVGTECKTPALFAVAWAKRFFERFLGGEPLGETFLGLRREFLENHRNPLGLLYAVHCDGDTQISPAL
jgi:hypothetical protein